MATNTTRNNSYIADTNLQNILHKEIDLIEQCISRMSQHSFYLKAWTISLIGVIFTFLANKNIKDYIPINIILIISTIAFWYLDSYFLRLGRMYRKLYSWVIVNRMTTTEKLYNLDAKQRFKSNVDGQLKTMFSESVIIFYGMILFLLLIFLIYNLHPQITNILHKITTMLHS